MYFPYLRGKQFELIALREFAIQYPNTEQIIPIIEPVKSTFNGLTTAARIMFEQNLRFALVLNPADGDFKRITKDILSEISILSENMEKWIPTFLYQNNGETILSAIQDQELNNVMVIFKNGIDISDNILNFLSHSQIQYIVNGDPNSRITMRRLSRLENKRIIRLDNCFAEQPRNVDYLNIPEDKFTEQHRFYSDDHFYGISDYTALPKDFIDGGMLPYAVAIHMTYEKNQDEIYVRHFVSDTNDDQSNIQRKFFEAATKLKYFFTDRTKTTAINELIKLLDDEKYPGLGVIKKLSIKNHIELMNSILTE
ncbi:sce7725 family protein [Bacteroides fragilis]|uniref:Sce7725 family protein n=1 Tax=Bacteroides fragilis TaxID=817 RepID=A0ABD4VNB1_BACFG|nr:sce7725 family protein [Bacteroides fragilis]MCE8617564.1 sce7725 family protein [Bacteroides fragilis]MCZ2601773.1 sce7725 family protein [Bacteroides fragilis]MCZ2652935.1 sce7725 family protein [Bacteroides fragilis]UHZ88114.1 sce7725 family protein [Bacteroides fragilis]